MITFADHSSENEMEIQFILTTLIASEALGKSIPVSFVNVEPNARCPQN